MVMEMWACLVKYASKQCIILVDWMMEAIATVSLHCPEGLSVCLSVYLLTGHAMFFLRVVDCLL